MKDKLVELHRRAFEHLLETGEPFSHENYADFLVSEGVIVPPCRVGSVVYRVSFVHKTVEMLNVEGFLCNIASWKAHCTRFIPSWVGNKKEHIYISFSLFGKTVFLTPGEAEKALAERGDE